MDLRPLNKLDGQGREQKEKLFLLCDDELLLLIYVRPLNKLMDSVENRGRKCFVWILNILIDW